MMDSKNESNAGDGGIGKLNVKSSPVKIRTTTVFEYLYGLVSNETVVHLVGSSTWERPWLTAHGEPVSDSKRVPIKLCFA
ncbi:hypothetical protein KIN20_032860 [Parelaphostrongylus tenuis]|uniref:Uncharacterized protein n=1 Tax=Parelaphostrongylus tenuis TaxID=148309 RepID=A0AAD5WHS6_PARTN|nr:hypothetical protein KIN20_032860 [Parelaphostrongylus tenuis]